MGIKLPPTIKFSGFTQEECIQMDVVNITTVLETKANQLTKDIYEIWKYTLLYLDVQLISVDKNVIFKYI